MLLYIVGAPKTGKTTRARALADETGAALISTDAFLDRPHAEQPDAVIGAIRAALQTHPDCIVEGTTVARLLPHRADGVNHGAPRPDAVVWCRGPSEFDPRYAGLTTWITRMAEDYAKHEPVTTRRLDDGGVRADAGPSRTAAGKQRVREALVLGKMMGRRRAPRRAIPPQNYPRAIEAQFARMMGNLVRGLAEDLGPLYDVLPETIVQLKLEREDAARFDAGERFRISEILESIRKRMQARLEPNYVRAGATRIATFTSDFQRRQFANQARAGLGVDIIVNDAGVAGAIDDFVVESVAAIRHVPTKIIADVERVVFEGFAVGETYATTAEKIGALLKVSEEKAYSVAGQAVGKLNARVTQLRQRNMGVEAYTWRTARDEKVRPAHRAREGHRYTWDDPPNGETPGSAPGWFPCRCYPEPDFAGLLEGE